MSDQHTTAEQRYYAEILSAYGVVTEAIKGLRADVDALNKLRIGAERENQRLEREVDRLQMRVGIIELAAPRTKTIERDGQGNIARIVEEPA